MGKVKFTVECEMEERWADRFCSFLTHLATNGAYRRSEIVGFYSDGDGDFRPKFKFDRDFNFVLTSARKYNFIDHYRRPEITLYDAK